MVVTPWVNLGYDESNHGRYPEVCVLVASNDPEDIKRRSIDTKLPKLRRKHDKIEKRLEAVDYRFLFFDYNDRQRLFIPSTEIDYGFRKIGIIIASLIFGERLGDHLNLYVDGDHYRHSERAYLLDILKDITGFDNSSIRITYGAELDRFYNVVNIADETAYCLLPNSTFAELRDSKKRKPLRLEESLLDVSV